MLSSHSFPSLLLDVLYDRAAFNPTKTYQKQNLGCKYSYDEVAMHKSTKASTKQLNVVKDTIIKTGECTFA